MLYKICSVVVGASPEKIVPDPRFATLRDVCIIVGSVVKGPLRSVVNRYIVYKGV